MLQLQLLELAKKQLPNINLESKEDIIKVEKILKSEAKLGSNVNLNAVEYLLTFLKSYGSKFLPILGQKNIEIIIKGNGDFINPIPFKSAGIEDGTLLEFQNVFETNIYSYLNQCIKLNSWNSLKNVFTLYPFLVSEHTKEKIYQTLSLKNEATISAIDNDQYIEFSNANPYSCDVAYYTALSTIEPYYFDEDILTINNLISKKQRNTKERLYFLGRILYAITFFEAYGDDLRDTLRSNQDIAYSWMNPNYGQKAAPMDTTNIIIMVITGVVILGVIIAIPGTSGAAVGLGIFITRMIVALRKK
ncbi:MAG: hypothetical protein EOO90_25120 [Pedobacter sp.]|nr:MAG: hypothetical protein EOO90_25120 [Pedobacter sp.]